MKRKPITEYTRQKMRISHLGNKHSEEHKHQMSLIAKAKGFGKWMKGKKISEETRAKMSLSQIGRKNSEQHNINIGLGKVGKPNINLRGVNHHHWKGGITRTTKAIRTSLEYKNWRRFVFERDGYTCLSCGIRGNQTGGYLQAHHIQPFSVFPEYRFDVSNGITLCLECHKETDSFAGRGLTRK